MRIAFVLVAAVVASMAVAAQAQSVTDAQIASIVVTANQVDIDAGKLAAEKGSDKVRAFGTQMVTDQYWREQAGRGVGDQADGHA